MDTCHKDPLLVIAGNRRALRARGATSQTLQCVETYFRLKRKRARIGLADVARVLGVTRQLVSRQFDRASRIGLVAKVGRAFILNVRGLLEWAEDAVAERIKAAKRRFTKAKAESVNKRFRHNERETKEKAEAVPATLPDRQTALKELALTYRYPDQRRHI